MRSAPVAFLVLCTCAPLAGIARPALDSLLHLLGTTPLDTHRVSLLNQVAEAYEETTPDSMIAFSTRGAELAERLGFRRGRAQGLSIIGRGHMAKGEYGIAIPFMHRALAIWTTLGEVEQQRRLHFNLAWMAQQRSDFPESLKQYLATLKLAEQLGDSTDVVQLRMNIGNVYDQMGDTVQAIATLRTVLHMYERIGDSLGIAQACGNLGTVLDNSGQHTEALAQLTRSRDIALALKDPMGEAITLGAIANHYQHLQQFDVALKYNEELLRLFEQLGDPHNLAAASINTGEILTRLKRYDEAKQHLNKGIELARSVGVKQWLANAHGTLYEIADAQGDAPEGLEQYKLHIAYRDSIANEANTRKAVQVQMQYDFDKKEDATRAAQEKKDALHAGDVRRKVLQRNALLGFGALGITFAVVDMRRRRRIKQEHARSEALLLNILPAEVASELKAKGHADAKHFDSATILFTDFKGFTEASEKLSPQELVEELNTCFKAFDGIITARGIEKIKTIGDAYMCAGGLPVPSTSTPAGVVQAALEMQAFMYARKKERDALRQPAFEMRVGIHTGPVVAGIVGVKKFQYDIWGDTVNTASRMESSGEVGQVNISANTYALVKDNASFTFTPRGKVQAKGKGELEMYFVERTEGA